MKTMPSLLAPAGNMRALQTALRFGADAVYCGAKQYGLRAQAGNFDEKQLEQAYLPRLRPGSRVFYKNMIGQIMEEIDKFQENQRNRPLEPSYLMGYYLQRSALYQKKENEQNEEDSKQ